MKNFVVKYGSFVVNIIAFFAIVGMLISSVSVMINQGFWTGLISLWAGITGFVVAFFMIYLVMSVNDNLREINEKLGNKY